MVKVATRQRGIGISRVLEFFRSGNEDEVRVVLQLALEAAGQRHILINGPQPTAPAPFKRHRRTKAQIAAAAAPEGATSLKNWPETGKAEGATA